MPAHGDWDRLARLELQDRGGALIAVNTQLLVYAHREDAVWHDAAIRVVAGLAEGPASWAIPWPCVHEFLAIITHHAPVLRPATPLERAIAQVEASH